MITYKRIRFRGAERTDIPNFTRWMNDPEVTAGITVYRPMSLVNEENWFENMVKRPLDEQIFVIEICPRGEWLPIGSCGYHEIDWRNRNTEVGIAIGEKAWWNKGYGSEAMELLVKYGFETLNMHRVWLRVFENNKRAVRSYEKVGFVHEGQMRESDYKNGKYHNILLMSILKQEYHSID
ncbi:MAG: GNAT family protein [Anaerolineaceae bacterium]